MVSSFYICDPLALPHISKRILFLLTNSDAALMGVVLFNGGVKSSHTNQGSGDINLKFKEACLFARRIEQALREKEINIRKRKIYSANDDDEIFL